MPECENQGMVRSFEDDTLGTIQYDKRFGWWSTIAELIPDLEIDLTLELGAAESVPESILNAFKHLQNHEPELRATVCSHLLELAEEWRDEDDTPGPQTSQPWTLETFKQAISITSASFDEDGSAIIYYDDGEVFAGHVIVVGVSSDGEFQDASIAG
jgi:hypothetical protein